MHNAHNYQQDVALLVAYSCTTVSAPAVSYE